MNGFQFYRQRIIVNYIVDFFCPKAELVIEVDGSQHYSGETSKNDLKRDEYFKSIGLKVLRFSDREVLTNMDGVLESIIENLGGKGRVNPPVSPFPEKRADGLS